MIRKLPRHTLRTAKYSLMGVCMQCSLVGGLWAADTDAMANTALVANALSPSAENVVFQRSVSGRVIDQETSEGLPGVNVIVKGTTTGTVTDIDGNFSLDVTSSESVLIFSSIGYASQEIVVGQNAVINVSLATDVLSLSEVVIVGYGEQKK